MIKYIVQPWPSTYKQLGKTEPEKLKSRYDRLVGAFRSSIPPRTIEPPQIHLDAKRDGKPFEELLTGFEIPFRVALLNPRNNSVALRDYSPGEEIIVPEYVIHWLINPNTKTLEFTCEYAPHPWDEMDEPEFPDLDALLKHVDERGLRDRVLRAEF